MPYTFEATPFMVAKLVCRNNIEPIENFIKAVVSITAIILNLFEK